MTDVADHVKDIGQIKLSVVRIYLKYSSCEDLICNKGELTPLGIFQIRLTWNLKDITEVN